MIYKACGGADLKVLTSTLLVPVAGSLLPTVVVNFVIALATSDKNIIVILILILTLTLSIIVIVIVIVILFYCYY